MAGTLEVLLVRMPLVLVMAVGIAVYVAVLLAVSLLSLPALAVMWLRGDRRR